MTPSSRATRKAGTILQLCVYSYLLETIQGTRPAHMHVVTPGTNFAAESYRTDDFGAYYPPSSSAASTNSWRGPGRPTRSWSRTATTARGGPQ